MSSIDRPASAMARSHACTVSASGGTISRRPSSELPIPLTATLSSNLSGAAIGRTCRHIWSGSISSCGSGAGSPCSADSTGAAGRKSGSHTSPAGSKTTSMRMPSSSCSGSHSTALVVSLTRGSSSIATCATTYGGGSPGRLNRWLTVNPMRVANPETTRTPIWWPRQYRQAGCGGWISARQDSHSCSRSRPSAPDVQKNSFSIVTSGTGRPAGSSIDNLSLGLPHGDRLGQPLLVADPLQGLDRLVEPGSEPGAGGEGGREVLHALDHADGLVMDRAGRVALVVGHPVEHGGDHALEHHPGHVRADAAVDAQPEAVVPVAGAGQVDLVGVVEYRRVAVGHRPGQPEPLALLELDAGDLAVGGDRASVAWRRAVEAQELLGGRIKQRVALPAQPLPLARVLGHPLERVRGQRGRGVEPAADEQGHHPEQFHVGRGLAV